MSIITDVSRSSLKYVEVTVLTSAGKKWKQYEKHLPTWLFITDFRTSQFFYMDIKDLVCCLDSCKKKLIPILL
jgi:hypothetical protein